MKKLVTTVLAALLIAQPAHADTTSDLVGLGMDPELAEYVATLSTVLSNAEWVKARNQGGTADVEMLRLDSTDDTVLNCDDGDLCKVSVAKTPVAAIGAATPVAAFTPAAAANAVFNGIVQSLSTLKGADLSVTSATTDLPFAAGAAPKLVPYVPTMAATPAAGTNIVKIGVNVVPTAAADTAALMPTPTGGGQYLEVFNSGPNAVRIKAGGTNTINGSAGGAYIPLATFQAARCRSQSATAWGCELTVVPTPAGP